MYQVEIQGYIKLASDRYELCGITVNWNIRYVREFDAHLTVLPVNNKANIGQERGSRMRVSHKKAPGCFLTDLILLHGCEGKRSNMRFWIQFSTLNEKWQFFNYYYNMIKHKSVYLFIFDRFFFSTNESEKWSICTPIANTCTHTA